MNASLPFVPALGSKVYFGRSHGEQTLGEVVKVNRSRAKVRQLESRGVMKDHKVGTIWTVPFTLLTPAPVGAEPLVTSTNIEALGFPNTPVRAPSKRPDAEILKDIGGVYCDLSPENLTCDGELRGRRLQQKASALRAKLRVLFQEIGRVVPEEETWKF
jgi:hypothetical protein